MQNTFSQSGNDSKWFLKKSFFKIGMWHSRPPRDPPPFMAKTILNFHFDYWNPSLIEWSFSVFFCLCLFSSLLGMPPWTNIAVFSWKWRCVKLREGLNEKKNVFFRALPELTNPPPLTHIRATWSFFSDVKIQYSKVTCVCFFFIEAFPYVEKYHQSWR